MSFDREKIIGIESMAGVSQDAFNRKYSFHHLKERFLNCSDLSLDIEGHENLYMPLDYETPTMVDGLSYEDELALRIHGAQLCLQASCQLKLPITTAITSLVIYQRFFTKYNLIIKLGIPLSIMTIGRQRWLLSSWLGRSRRQSRRPGTQLEPFRLFSIDKIKIHCIAILLLY